MLYSLTKEQLKKLFNLHHLSDFINAEMLVATFKTNMDVVKEIIPRPLIPTKDALATAFVARYPETNFGCVYNEGALFIHCEYRGEKGLYCLSMPVDDDTAMIGGRESYGYPKKMAEIITLEHENNRVLGTVIRKEVEILRIEGQLGNETSENVFDDLGKSIADWDGVPSYLVISFLFKYFQSPNGSSFDYFPRLIRQPILFRRQGKISEVTGKVLLSSTPCDPLGEIPVGEIKEMFYGKWHNTMLPGKVIAKIWNPIRFARYAFFKNDSVLTLLSNYDPNLSARAKKIMKTAKRF
jgi:acetoacetate decarboxylase